MHIESRDKSEMPAVNLGENIFPFAKIQGLSQLENGPTRDVLYKSDEFEIKDVGVARIILLDARDVISDFEDTVLRITGDNATLVSPIHTLASVWVNLNLFSKDTPVPDRCVVVVKNLELFSRHEDLDPKQGYETELAYDFFGDEDRGYNDLLIRKNLNDIRQIGVRFEPSK